MSYFCEKLPKLSANPKRFWELCYTTICRSPPPLYIRIVIQRFNILDKTRIRKDYIVLLDMITIYYLECKDYSYIAIRNRGHIILLTKAEVSYESMYI